MSFVRFLATESKDLYNTDLKSVLTWVYDLFVKVEESKRPRDPRPLLRPYPGHMSQYDYTGLHMALLSSEGEVITAPTHCRDYFNEVIRYHVTDGKAICSYVYRQNLGKFDRDNLRFVCLSDTSSVFTQSVYDGIENGLRLADMYGRVAGWKNFQLVRCLLPLGEDEAFVDVEPPPRECYAIIGDKNWQRTPQFISLLILLIRICLVHKVPDWITDAYSLQGYWYELLFVESRNRTGNSDFSVFLYNSYDKLLTLVAHEREIFPHDIDGGFNAKIPNFHLKSGLDSLVKMSSIHPESAHKLDMLYREVSKYARQSN